MFERAKLSAQQVIYATPSAGPVISVPPYGVPCGGYCPFNSTYAYPVAPWCPAVTYVAKARVVYVRPKRVVVPQ